MYHAEIDVKYADRVDCVPKSYVREILKVTEKPGIISFAGGLPNPELFPVSHIKSVTQKVLDEDGANILQYSSTEGYQPLRQYIAERYYKGCGISAENILITSGSQQALDLIAKVIINKDDFVMLERPGYLGAIQCFSMYQPQFITVGMETEGINIDEFEEKLKKFSPKLFYAVTNFQNPTGITYSNKRREKIAEILELTETIMIDDNPYGELRFYGKECKTMKMLLENRCISLGSFSKIFAPSMRLGWLCASEELVDKLVTMKQASDLHTNYFCQRVLYQYLSDFNIDDHITIIVGEYKKRRDFMVEMIQKYIPSDVKFTEPEGGMFLWMTLPDNINVTQLLEAAGKANVAFVPGVPFYAVNEENPNNTLRLNYTNSSLDEIEKGIKAMAKVIAEGIGG